jgi:5-methyltetrahydropteroyltriglutamate--homocysteine methyltransferase
VHDFDLRHFADLMLTIRAQAYLNEGANPRHEHEWEEWKTNTLPDDKVLIAGVIDTSTNFIEHPRLVAQRIVRYANAVGRERVIAGTDCGLGTFAGFGPVHPDIAWAKLQTLAEGAAIASEQLFGAAAAV